MAASVPIMDLNGSNGVNINRPESTKSFSAAPLSPTPEWGTDTVSLKDFAVKRTIPGFAKVVKGNYMTLGSSKFSFQKQHHEVFIHSVKVAVKVLAHSVRRVEASSVTKKSGHSVRSRVYAVDQRLAIPISYQGWFELLSEDGKSARPITSVHELSKVRPKRCLVRENTKAYILKEESKSTFDKTRIVLAGEQLVLNGELALPSSHETKKVKMLRCFDSKGEEIYLSFDQKGMFTPIAGEYDVAGVFLIRDIVRRFRLPLTVKLVQGMRPKVDPSRFTGLIRLDWVYSDETAFVCPIEKSQIRLLPVPTDANLQLVAATNQQAMKSTDLFQHMTTKCNRMISNYNNTIHLIVNLPEAASKGKARTNSNVFSMPLTEDSFQPVTAKSEKRENRIMNEIDDLYGYVRDGGAVPKFQYDSDEESFWEEPAYEPLDDFRARLQALEAGEKVSYHSKYQPQDFEKLDILANQRTENDSTYGVLNGPLQSSNENAGSSQVPPPPLPPRLPDVPPTPPMSPPPVLASVLRRQSSEAPNRETYFPLSRRKSEGYVTTVSSQGVVSSHHIPSSNHQGGHRGTSREIVEHQKRHSRESGEAQRRHSKGSLEAMNYKRENSSTSGSSGQGHHRLLARDFKDSDISSVTKRSSSSSGGPVGRVRRKLQTLYL